MNSKDKQSLNAAEISTNQLTADIVVIGSGAGGGVSAEIFAVAGFSVLIIEEGPYLSGQDFNMLEKEAYPLLYQEAAGRKTADQAINILQGRSVGGSTTVNWTSSFRTPERTLSHWQENWGLDNLSATELSPWFEKMEQRLNIKPWQIPANYNNQVIENGANKLGWSSSIIARNVKGCANLGYCGLGCPLNAKQSMLVTTIPAAKKLGARVLYQARVESLELKKDQVVGCKVQAVDLQSKPIASRVIKVKAKHIVLSAGAIGSSAILLNSRVPDPYQLIGSRTFLHPVVASASMMKDTVAAYSGAPQSIYSDQFLWPSDPVMGFKIEAAPLHPSIVSTVLSSFAEQHFQLMKSFSNLQACLALLRDGFDEQSVGGQVYIQQGGYPKLDYPLNDYFWKSAKKALLAMAELQFAAGAKKVLPLDRDANTYDSWRDAKKNIKQLSMQKLKTLVVSAHVMGGNRMGAKEQNSVLDQQAKFRHLSGLHVLDGSIFPTSIGANPQLSIYAITAKLASELAQNLNRG